MYRAYAALRSCDGAFAGRQFETIRKLVSRCGVFVVTRYIAAGARQTDEDDVAGVQLHRAHD
jgi:hypothetical protein